MKKLFFSLYQYYGIKLFFNRAYAVHSTDGKTFKRNKCCFLCGNIANAGAQIVIGKTEFVVPVCKPHAEKYLLLHDPELLDKIRYYPFIFKMNLKFTAK